MDTIVFIRSTGIYCDSRATKEITDIAKSGRYVIVLSWDRDGKADKECQRAFEKEKNVTFRFYHVQAVGKIGSKNILKMLGWFKWVNKQLWNIDKIRVIHACDLDAGFPAYYYCKKRRIPLVYDIYDYYIDCHATPKLIEPLIEQLEIKMINYSCLTIICTEERIEQIKKASPKKTIVLHNSPDIQYENVSDTVYDFVYCGGLDNKRLINEILDKYHENADLRFYIAGFGENEETARQLSEKYADFVYNGTILYKEVIETEEKSRCLSAIYDPSFRNHQFCAPNKFYEAMALGKPVIVCRGTGIDKVVEKYKLGMVINYDVDEFYQTVRYLLKSPSECKKMGENGRKLYMDKYQWAIMRERLLSSYDIILK